MEDNEQEIDPVDPDVDDPAAGHAEPAPEPERGGPPEGFASGAEIPGHPEPSPIHAIQRAAADAAAPGVEGYQDDPTVAHLDRAETDPPVQASGEADPTAGSGEPDPAE